MRLIHINMYDVKLLTKAYKLSYTRINVKLQNNIFLAYQPNSRFINLFLKFIIGFLT